MIFSPRPHDSYGLTQLKISDSLIKKGDPSKKRLEERHRQIWTKDRQRDARQSGAATDVDHSRSLWDQISNRDRVEDVTIPEPWHLTWTDQSPIDSSICQYIDISIDQ